MNFNVSAKTKPFNEDLLFTVSPPRRIIQISCCVKKGEKKKKKKDRVFVSKAMVDWIKADRILRRQKLHFWYFGVLIFLRARADRTFSLSLSLFYT